MALWQDAFYDWGPAWAAAQDLDAQIDGGVVRIGAGTLAMWPGDDESSTSRPAPLTLVTDDVAGATSFAATLGMRVTERWVLLTAQTDSLDLIPDLPPEANLAEAPMENYDLVEVALFDRPVAHGRLSLGEDVAVLARLSVDADHADLTPRIEQAMVAALGEEAFTHGAETLFLIADEEQAARFAEVEGWSRAAEVLSFEA